MGEERQISLTSHKRPAAFLRFVAESGQGKRSGTSRDRGAFFKASVWLGDEEVWSGARENDAPPHTHHPQLYSVEANVDEG